MPGTRKVTRHRIILFVRIMVGTTAAPPSGPRAGGPVLLDEPLPISHGTAAPARLRIGLCCMTKRPIHFETWLSYHAEVIGVERFYIRVEDTPELESLLTSASWASKVDATFDNNTSSNLRDYEAQTVRQSAHVEAAIARVARDGLTHLLHLRTTRRSFQQCMYPA